MCYMCLKHGKCGTRGACEVCGLHFCGLGMQTLSFRPDYMFFCDCHFIDWHIVMSELGEPEPSSTLA